MDVAGRKQYLYHERWRTRRDQAKFDRMLEFAQCLPGMRKRVSLDLRPTTSAGKESWRAR